MMVNFNSIVGAFMLATVVVADDGLQEPPQVLAAVQSALSEFSQYTDYQGPTGTASAAAQTSKPKPKIEVNVAAAACAPYWMETINHQGIAAFNSNPTGYKVFRNVKDYGAKGDGVTDDTAAIQAAINDGNRCAPGACQASTVTPAVVYFPSGTYVVSHSIIDYYETQLIGNPNCPPTLLATAAFTGPAPAIGLIEGDEYQHTGAQGYGSTNVFYRQIRNFVIDMTNIPSTSYVMGIHWPTAQATSIQNVVFHMSAAPGTQHFGIFIENGSGGFVGDLVFNGGLYGLNVGNQQFTMRNLTFNNQVTAINQIWDWGFTYKSVSINNCQTGLNMGSQNVGSVTFIDSSISNTPVGVNTSYVAGSSQPPEAGSLIIENVMLNNVPVAVQGPEGTRLAGGTTTIAGWGQGHSYTPTGPNNFQGTIPGNTRPASLLAGGIYYERSKPLYGETAQSSISSVRSGGAKGDGVTDDTAALQAILTGAAASNNIVFFDAGTYKITKTLYIPGNSKIVGETYPVIMSSGAFFGDMTNPQPVVRVGNTGEAGAIEWSDMVVSTQGAQAGAVLIEWNLNSPANAPSGMWDVHTRVGGFDGSNLQVAQCPKTPTTSTPPAAVNAQCIAAFLMMHVTTGASGLYMENVWLWTADHDIDDVSSTQITIYTGRGLLVESSAGTIWLYGTAVEHASLYQYQFANTKNIFAGQIQTETAYYQPNPPATEPFPAVASLNDPVFSATGPGNNANGWGLRVLNSQSILFYGAGLYSFFDNYSTNCSAVGAGEACQSRIFSLEGSSSSNVDIYNLNTIGSTSMIDRDGTSLASFSDNINVFPDTIAEFRSN